MIHLKLIKREVVLYLNSNFNWKEIQPQLLQNETHLFIEDFNWSKQVTKEQWIKTKKQQQLEQRWDGWV